MADNLQTKTEKLIKYGHEKFGLNETTLRGILDNASSSEDLTTELNTQDELLTNLETEINSLPEADVGGGSDNRLAQLVSGDLVDAPKEFWNGITRIGAYGCAYRYNLESIHLPSGIILGPSSFYNGPKLKTVILEEGITEIPSACFDMCRAMEYIDIPSSVEKIGSNGLNFFRSGTITSTALTMRFRGETPPAISSSSLVSKAGIYYTIEVPKGCLEAYKTAVNWDTYDIDNGGPATFVESEEAPNE